jgi:hypothetical protein
MVFAIWVASEQAMLKETSSRFSPLARKHSIGSLVSSLKIQHEHALPEEQWDAQIPAVRVPDFLAMMPPFLES